MGTSSGRIRSMEDGNCSKRTRGISLTTIVFTVVSANYERNIVILPSNKIFGAKGELHVDSVIASASMEHPLHRSHELNIPGDNYRVKDKRQGAVLPQPNCQVEQHSQ